MPLAVQAAKAISIRPPLVSTQLPVAELQRTLAQHCEHFLPRFQLTDAPADALDFSQWVREERFSRLLADYAAEIYRPQPEKAIEGKPLQSLWAQWYFGLLIPPVLVMLLTQDAPLDCALSRFRVVFHPTGRPECFYFSPRVSALPASLRERIESLLLLHLQPVVTALDHYGVLNARLNWNNIGYLLHWYLRQYAELLSTENARELHQQLFFTPHLQNGSTNPLYRTVILRQGQIQRRSCCQRYKLPEVQRCTDCTLCGDGKN